MSQSDDSSEIIERLLAIHGEGGACPSADDWRTIFAQDETRPVELLNLLKFKAQVDTPAGSISGADAYRRYTANTAGAFARAGAELLFFGRVRHMFAFGGGPDWDLAVLTRYPSPRALAGMWLDSEFVAAHENRLEAIERSQVLLFGARAP